MGDFGMMKLQTTAIMNTKEVERSMCDQLWGEVGEWHSSEFFSNNFKQLKLLEYY